MTYIHDEGSKISLDLAALNIQDGPLMSQSSRLNPSASVKLQAMRTAHDSYTPKTANCYVDNNDVERLMVTSAVPISGATEPNFESNKIVSVDGDNVKLNEEQDKQLNELYEVDAN